VLSVSQIKRFQKKILTWYRQHQRDLPWRKTRDPYKILVSELMLQQTQVGRVIPKYEMWLEAFPTVSDLARAKTAEVLRLWSGLGYNRRALYLQKAAQTIVRDYKGIWPRDFQELERLPGIGSYTSRAVACFAFDQQVAVVDTNIRKVILLEVLHEADNTMDTKTMQGIAEQLLPKGKAYEWNQALMDYSSSVLKKEKIPIVKQSRFIGSNRFYRGQIIKYLTKVETAHITDLLTLLKLPSEKIENILAGLEKDTLVVVQDGRVSILS
jgi:A/G-specific adenine glycosylase